MAVKKNNSKIVEGLVAVAILGGGIYLLTRKSGSNADATGIDFQVYDSEGNLVTSSDTSIRGVPGTLKAGSTGNSITGGITNNSKYSDGTQAPYNFVLDVMVSIGGSGIHVVNNVLTGIVGPGARYPFSGTFAVPAQVSGAGLLSITTYTTDGLTSLAQVQRVLPVTDPNITPGAVIDV